MKEYLLLAGKEPKYQKLYEGTVKGVNEHLLFRPMTEGDWDILFPAKLSTVATEGSMPELDYEVTHLTCFIGGMYGLGSKLFGREEDLEYAKKLTDGCVWAYQSTATGIMPEYAHVVPCPSLDKCSFDEKLWLESLDPKAATRDEEVRLWEESQRQASGFDAQLHESPPQHLVGDSHSVPKAPHHGSNDGSIKDKVAYKPAIGSENTLDDTLVRRSDGSTSTSQRNNPSEVGVGATREQEVGRLEKRAAIPVDGQDVVDSSTPLAAKAPSTLNEPDNHKNDGEVARSDNPIGSTNFLSGMELHESNPNPQKLRDHVVEDAPSVPDHRVGSLRNHNSNLQKPLTHQEFVDQKIKQGVPRGFTTIQSQKYILR